MTLMAFENPKIMDFKSHQPNKVDFFSQSGFCCNICLDVADEPVVTLCGHLFCWPCYYQWTSSQFFNYSCPVCKAVCSKRKIIPIYGTKTCQSGKSFKYSSSGKKIPSRPSAPQLLSMYDDCKIIMASAAHFLFSMTYQSLSWLLFNTEYILRPIIDFAIKITSQSNKNKGLSHPILMVGGCASVILVCASFYKSEKSN